MPTVREFADRLEAGLKAKGWRVAEGNWPEPSVSPKFFTGGPFEPVPMVRFTWHCPCGRPIVEAVMLPMFIGNHLDEAVSSTLFEVNRELQQHVEEEAQRDRLR